MQRLSTEGEAAKRGVFTGSHAINPFTGAPVPIYLADYVLMEYGTGAIMAVPGQDQRDWDFAEAHGLPIIRTVRPPDGWQGEAFVDDGPAINSEWLDGLHKAAAIERATRWLEERGIGERKVNYRLRDWLISRQRYWGTPIRSYCEQDGVVAVRRRLPVLLPTDISFGGAEGNPLEHSASFLSTTCPRCGAPARRETDTMDTFVDSSWYYLRFISPRLDDAMFDVARVARWMPVDLYIGGIEHAILHLMYARFINRVLHDFGTVPNEEPFSVLFNQGMIVAPSNVSGKLEKMSKSKGNVVDPDELIARYGADTERVYTLFMSPPEKEAEWRDDGVAGAFRFLQRVGASGHARRRRRASGRARGERAAARRHPQGRAPSARGPRPLPPEHRDRRDDGTVERDRRDAAGGRRGDTARRDRDPHQAPPPDRPAHHRGAVAEARPRRLGAARRLADVGRRTARPAARDDRGAGERQVAHHGRGRPRDGRRRRGGPRTRGGGALARRQGGRQGGARTGPAGVVRGAQMKRQGRGQREEGRVFSRFSSLLRALPSSLSPLPFVLGLTLAAVAFLAGCGYGLVGTSSNLAPHLERLVVPFISQSGRAELDQRMIEAIAGVAPRPLPARDLGRGGRRRADRQDVAVIPHHSFSEMVAKSTN
jgi:hypothetical protein